MFLLKKLLEKSSNIVNTNNTVTIPIYPILILSFLWSYGYMGMWTKLSLTQFSFVTCGMGAILVFLHMWNKSFHVVKQDAPSLSFRVGRALTATILSLLFIAITWAFYNPSLIGDELAHSYYSQYHIIFLLSKLEPYYPTGQAANLIWIVNSVIIFGFLACFLFAAHLFRRFGKKNQIALSALFLALGLLVILRVILYNLGGFDPSHPPFRLFPLWFSSSIFGMKDLSFRIPGLVGLSLIAFIFYDSIKTNERARGINFLAVLSVCSMPILWSTSYIVEPSVWAALFSTYFIFMTTRSQLTVQKLRVLVSMLAIFILMRQSLVYLFPGLLFILILVHYNNSARSLREFMVTLAPLLITIPLILRSIVFGTPAQDYDSTEVNLNVLEKVVLAFESGLFFEITWNNLGYWSVFIFFALIPKDKSDLTNTALLIIVLFSGIVLFYSVRPALWGIPRYQCEFLVPIVLYGFANCLKLIANNKIKIFLLSLLIFLNGVKNLIGSVPGAQVNGHPVIETHGRYDIGEVLKAAKRADLAGKIAFLDNNYGPVLEINSGFSLAEVMLTININERLKLAYNDVDVNKLVVDPGIDLIIFLEGKSLARTPNFIKQLEAGGFRKWGHFEDGWRYEAVVGYVRH